MMWVVFDGWGVVYPVSDDIAGLLVPFLRERQPAVDAALVQELYFTANLGHISPREFWTRAGFGDQYPQIEQEYLDTRPTLDPNFIEAARTLSSKYPLAMLSNDLGNWSQHLRRRFGIEHLFKACVISGDVGCRKPDERIFHRLLERIGATADQCIFIDDRTRNLRVAADLGFRTVWINRDHQPPDDFVPTATTDTLANVATLIETMPV